MKWLTSCRLGTMYHNIFDCKTLNIRLYIRAHIRDTNKIIKNYLENGNGLCFLLTGFFPI